MGASNKLFSNASMLRANMTEAEKLLWENLRKKRLKKYRFRRQHPIGHYIADFYSHKAKLIIEVDGLIHDIDEISERDEGRTYDLEELGLDVIRFTNEEIIKDIESVIDKIEGYLESL